MQHGALKWHRWCELLFSRHADSPSFLQGYITVLISAPMALYSFVSLFPWFTCLFVCSGNLFTDFVACNLQNFPEGYRKIIMYLCSEVKMKKWFLLPFAFCQVQPNSKHKFHVQSCGYFSSNFILSFQPELDKIKRQFFSEQLFPEGVKDLERGYHQLLSINSQTPHKYAIWIW